MMEVPGGDKWSGVHGCHLLIVLFFSFFLNPGFISILYFALFVFLFYCTIHCI